MSWGDLKSGVVLWDPTILVQVLKLPKTGKRWSAQNFWTFKVRANRALFRLRQLPNRSRAAVQVGGYVLSSADTGLVAMWCSRAKGESWHGGVDLRIDSYDQPNQGPNHVFWVYPECTLSMFADVYQMFEVSFVLWFLQSERVQHRQITKDALCNTIQVPMLCQDLKEIHFVRRRLDMAIDPTVYF